MQGEIALSVSGRRRGAGRSRLRAAAALLVAGLLSSQAALAAPRAPSPPSLPSLPARPRLVGDLALAGWARPDATPRLPAIRLPVRWDGLAFQMQGPTSPPPGPLTPVRAADESDVTDKWWFWAAIGAVVATTVVLFIVASGGSDEPRTQLGNMDTSWK